MLEPLPVDAALDTIRAALRRARAVVIVAEPGAGKTTRVPPALLDAGRAIVLQPRRAAARSIAKRIAAERGWTLGNEVGWHVRFERRFERDTRLLLATEGVLTARLQQDPLLSDFATIVLDEFHERSIHADVAIALSKQALLARDDLRIVVMSATLDADRVASYLGRCEVVRVPGRLHPVTVVHAPRVSAPDAVLQALQQGSGNVLCFQPGALDIARTIADLRTRQPGGIDVLPLHGTLAAAEQDRALTPSSVRRVIVSTNIAETSVTVPGVTMVVDVGLEKVARYDADLAIDSLVTERISAAAAEQRAGRAGRIAPGIVYRLWEATDRLKPFREPEIHRVDLSGVVLDVAGWGGDPRTLDWFDTPRRDAVDAAIALLNRMAALNGVALTEIGQRMLRVPLHPRLARILVAADGRRDAVRAVALLAERHPWAPRTATTTSDLLSELDRWEHVPENVRAFAAQLEQVSGQRGQSRSIRTFTDEEELRRAIFAGYPDRVAQRRDRQSHRFLLSTGTGAVLSTESGVREADWVVALDVHAPTRASDVESRIRLASAIEKGWLAPTSSEVVYRVDEHGAVKARTLDRYDALTLHERLATPDRDRAASLLAGAWLSRTVSEADEQILRRLNFAGIEIDLAALIGTAAHGAKALGDIRLANALPRDVSLALDRNAPESLRVPSGRSVHLEYNGDGSVTAAVKLQELFGLADTPLLGPQRQPVLFSLLAPNGRPVQMTRDLKSFWNRTYPEVRKELRGRYPKHPWPEDPWNAVATHRAKPRAER